MRRTRTLALCVLATAIAACTRNPAPDGFLPKPLAAPSDPYGGWIELWSRGDSLSGEFLAYDRDSVFVLQEFGDVRAWPVSDVTRARIFWYDSQYSKTATWAALGTVSALSHGVVFVLSGPVWLIAGISSARADSRAALVEPGRVEWAEAARYARYPAGMPPNLPGRLPVKP